MAEERGQDKPLLELARHLKLIEDLWQKLYYVKWNPKSFTMLLRLAQDMVKKTREQGNDHLLNLVAQLEYHIKLCTTADGMPPESERQRLVSLIEAVRDILTRSTGCPLDDEPHTRPLLASVPEIILIAPNEQPSLVAKLRDSGYRVQCIADLAKAEEQIRKQPPSAVILDVDFPEGSMEAMSVIGVLYADGVLKTPALFLAERNDMTARLEAVQTGSAAYFSKPFEVDDVLAVLQDLLLPQTFEGYYRVLIVSDRSTEAWEIAGALEKVGVTPRVLTQPLQTLQDIHRFRPDLLLVDMDIKEVSGDELVRVVTQNRECETLPMILMCFPADLANHLETLNAPGASLIPKPISTDYLCWEIKQRLRRARSTRVKLNLLTDSDSVSGLYNRRWFIALLEQELETLGLRVQSVAVLFVTIDNLREIRDSSGVLIADEVLGQAAARLRRALNAARPAARFSDRIFAVLIPDVIGDGLFKIAQMVRDKLETGFYKVEEHALLLRTSIGLAAATVRGEDCMALIKRAESACGLARESKSERIYLQQSSGALHREREASSRLRMLREIQQIVERKQLWLVFQPIASMQGDPNERYEVLLRLRNGEGTDLDSGSVFGVVFDHEMGLALDRWVIEHSLEILQDRRLQTTLFIKVLQVTLQDQTFSGWLRGKLEQYGVEAQRIVFSVAEAAAERDFRNMLTFLRWAKALGCRFCLDRFGRGNDSLQILRNMGADYVKLDMYFVDRLAQSKKKQAQLQELVQTLNGFGAVTIVGGVEDVQAMPILWSLGVDFIQGFFLQQPYREMNYDFAEAAL